MKRLQDHISNGSPNRVADALFLYAEQDAKFKISNPFHSQHDKESARLRLQYYMSIYAAFRKKHDRSEKVSLRYVRYQIARMQTNLNPTAINRIIFAPKLIRHFLRQRNNQQYANHSISIKNIYRNLTHEHNLQALTASIKMAGFNVEIEGTLNKMIANNLPLFHIRYSDIHYPKTDFVLHFKKIPKSDLYYFEKFDAISRPTLDSLLTNDSSCISHTFSMQGKLRFSAGEAANLVNGKSVCRELDGKETWLMLQGDKGPQKRFQSISFDLATALQQLPLKLSDSQARSLIQSLKAGNAREAKLLVNGETVRFTLEAAPQRKTIDVVDKYGQVIDIARLVDRQSRQLSRRLAQSQNQSADEEIDLGHVPGYKSRVR